MGAKHSTEQQKASHQRAILRPEDVSSPVNKVLFLGPSNSGKSTCYYHLGYEAHKEDKKQIHERKCCLFTNCYDMFDIEHKVDTNELKQEITSRIADFDDFGPRVNLALRRRLPAFIDTLARDEATFEDLLMVHRHTGGIHSQSFNIGDVVATACDVGGQRSERKKWIHAFEDVKLVVFCINLSHVFQQLFEDETVNAFDEANDLLNQIAGSKFFQRTQILVLPTFWDSFCYLHKKHAFARETLKERFPNLSESHSASAAAALLVASLMDAHGGENLTFFAPVSLVKREEGALVVDAIGRLLIGAPVDDMFYSSTRSLITPTRQAIYTLLLCLSNVLPRDIVRIIAGFV